MDTTTPVPTGTLNFTDADTADTHTVSTSLASAVWSGGSTVPTSTVSAAQTALGTTLHDAAGTGSGSVDWAFGIADNQLDFLADGETLTLTYNVSVSDASESATQTVTVTVTGTNDARSRDRSRNSRTRPVRRLRTQRVARSRSATSI